MDMTTAAVGKRGRVGRGMLVGGAAIAGVAVATLAPGGAPMWIGLSAGLLAVINGHGKVTTP
jgi:hypothetical protein